MKTFIYPKLVSLGKGLSSTLVAVSIFVMATTAPKAQAQESVDNLPNLTRGFGFTYSEFDTDNNKAYEFYKKGDPSLETFKEFLRRDNINFVLGVASGDRPAFTKLVESAAVQGSVEVIAKKWGTGGGKPPSNRAILRSFNQLLISGQPQMIDAYGLNGGKTLLGPVYKRAIMLRRDGEASPETVESELTAYAKRIAREVEGISDRVMLYSLKGPTHNWPTPSYPTAENVKREYDAIIMIWPKKDRIIPNNFYGVPENYRVLSALNLAGYYYAKPAPEK